MFKPQYADHIPRAVRGKFGKDERSAIEEDDAHIGWTFRYAELGHALDREAYLDSEQRINCAKVVKRFIMHSKKTAFVVEHDFIIATYLTDRVVVYNGNPGIEATASAPRGLLSGMNEFLKSLEVTFRHDSVNVRTRINKRGSQKDQEQKANSNYSFYDDGGHDDDYDL